MLHHCLAECLSFYSQFNLCAVQDSVCLGKLSFKFLLHEASYSIECWMPILELFFILSLHCLSFLEGFLRDQIRQTDVQIDPDEASDHKVVVIVVIIHL